MPDLIVDALRPADLPEALALSSAAGWNQLAPDWSRLLELSPDGGFAGRLDGRLVATATSASPAPGLSWIGMVLVDECCRGRGFGSRLLERALAHARQLAPEGVGLDATEFGRPLYLKLGFHDVAPVDRWSGPLRGSAPIRTPSIERVLDLDRAATGLDRGALLKHLAGETDVQFFEADGGYALLRPGRVAFHLGPVIAPDAGSLSSLLDQVSASLEGSTVQADVPRSAERTAVYAAHGLTVQRRLMRMTWGETRPLLLNPEIAAAVAFEWA